MVKQIYSAGIIVYALGQYGREYLLLQYHSGYWDLVKGKLEAGETAQQAALRELEEETGITDIDIKDGFKESLSYQFYDQDRCKVDKTVYFFTGEAASKKISLSSEHRGYTWLDYDHALYRLTYENAQGVLKKANCFLCEKK